MKHNKNYGRIEKGNVVYAPVPIRVNNQDIYTNDATVYQVHGYKTIRYTEMPEPIDGIMWIPVWIQDDTTITRMWEQQPAPIAEPIEDLGAIIDILTGEVD